MLPQQAGVMINWFVAKLPRKQMLCAASELSTRVLGKVFSPTLVPINDGRDQQRMSGFPSGSAWSSFH
jgi:hypothetical protein